MFEELFPPAFKRDFSLYIDPTADFVTKNDILRIETLLVKGSYEVNGVVWGNTIRGIVLEKFAREGDLSLILEGIQNFVKRIPFVEQLPPGTAVKLLDVANEIAISKFTSLKEAPVEIASYVLSIVGYASQKEKLETILEYTKKNWWDIASMVMVPKLKTLFENTYISRYTLVEVAKIRPKLWEALRVLVERFEKEYGKEKANWFLSTCMFSFPCFKGLLVIAKLPTIERKYTQKEVEKFAKSYDEVLEQYSWLA